MTGKFPTCVLNVQIPFNTVDVNVHPAKIEVRFSNERPVFDAVYRGCKEALGTAGEADFLPKEEPVKAAPSPFALKDFDHTGMQQRMTAAEYRTMSSGNRQERPALKAVPERRELSMRSPSMEEAMEVLREHRAAAPVKNSFPGRESRPSYPEQVRTFFEPEKQVQPVTEPRQEPAIQPSMPDRRPRPEPESIPAAPAAVPVESEKTAPVRPEPAAIRLTDDREEQDTDYRILGELFGTYIMVEYKDTFVLVDKHAAHERILYNRLCRETSLGQRQILLAPVPVTLSRQEYDAALRGLEAFEQIGFLLEDFGNGTVLVREIPTMLPLDDVTGAVQEAAAKLADGRQQMLPETVDELLHSVACKAAIKAHDTTSLPEMAQLVEVIRQDRDVRFCPHGRPVSVTMTRSELERKFGRLV